MITIFNRLSVKEGAAGQIGGRPGRQYRLCPGRPLVLGERDGPH